MFNQLTHTLIGQVQELVHLVTRICRALGAHLRFNHLTVRQHDKVSVNAHRYPLDNPDQEQVGRINSLTAATGEINGSLDSVPASINLFTASFGATQPPVIDAHRVPPSA